MADEGEARYELFIVHAEADRAWVDGYLRHAVGVDPARLITPRDFQLGAAIPAEFDRAVASSRYTALVLSPAFLADRWAEFGEQLVTFTSVEERRGRVVALTLHPCVPPPRLRFRVGLNCTDWTQWDEEVKRLRDLLDRPEPPPEVIPCPYPGMVPFTEKDHARFYGRTKKIDEVVGRLSSDPFLLVIGPSGSGKSSLISAGVVPKLRQSELFDSGDWLVHTFRPTDKPLAELETALSGEPVRRFQPGGKPLAELVAALSGEPALRDKTVAELPATCPGARRLLLIIDQFEELYALRPRDATSREETHRFQQAVLELAEVPGCYVILAVRADFYADLMVEPFWSTIAPRRVEVASLDEVGLREAIVRPAEKVAVFLDSVLVETLIRDAAGEPGMLPMLQATMRLLWGRRQERFLPFEAYRELGDEKCTGLQVAMALHADTALAALKTPEKQKIARRIFLRLVQFGEGRADTRRQQTIAELSVGSDPALFQQTLDLLTDRRLLTTSGDERTASRRVDLAHEALISGWPKLQEWLGERRGAEQTRRRLDAKADEWVRLQGTGGLLDVAELPEAEQWLASRDAADLGYSETLLKLIKLSRDAVDKAEREREEALQERMARQLKRQADADGLVKALESAEMSAVPEILRQLGADLCLVEDRLREMAQADDTTPGGIRRRLHAALALLSGDPTQVDYLVERLLRADARPDELLVIRKELDKHGHASKLTPELRTLLEETSTGLTDSQLRAAGALALFEPKDPRWPDLGPQVAAMLVRQNPLLIGAWREAFQAVAPALTPPLRQHFADRGQPEQRALAYTMLFEFATNIQADDPRLTEDMAELIGEADPAQFDQVLEILQADRDRAIGLLAGKLDELARFDDALARRQGQIATALGRLGRADRVWPLLKHSEDPSVRTELIHDLAKFRVKVDEVITRLKVEPEVSARRALVLALGAYPADQIPAGERQGLASMLLAWCREDPDPGVHGGIDWLLRQQWGQAEALDHIDQELAGWEPLQGRHWYVNGQGQTFAVVRGPVEFRMGSPEQEPDRDLDEVPHRKRIERSFAIAAKEVTVAQYAQFLKENPDVANNLDDPLFKQVILTPDCAMCLVDWYDAARYCNWLSRVEGIPEDQWCYPEEIGPGMTLPADHLKRTGYRLPTEAEWEYACRAGSAAARPYGGSEALLPEYGWYLANAGRRMRPVGGKKPNDLGLFDVLGNAWEWTLDPYGAYRPGRGNNPSMDKLMRAEFSDQVDRVLRGGSFDDAAPDLRSALRDGYRPSLHDFYYGLRPARTYR